MYSVYDWYNQ